VTHKSGVAKQGIAGLMDVLMMEDAASAERKSLSLNLISHPS
jgi:hypothetical protein